MFHDLVVQRNCCLLVLDNKASLDLERTWFEHMLWVVGIDYGLGPSCSISVFNVRLQTRFVVAKDHHPVGLQQLTRNDWPILVDNEFQITSRYKQWILSVQSCYLMIKASQLVFKDPRNLASLLESQRHQWLLHSLWEYGERYSRTAAGCWCC